MKKSILAAVCSALLMSFTANTQEKIKGNGNIISQTRTTGDYDAIKVAGSFDVELVSGKEGIISIKGEENLLPYVKVEVKENVLKIYIEKNTQIKPSTREKIQIVIPFEKISAVALVGSGDIQTKNVIKSDVFSAKLAGSGNLNLDVNSNALELNLSGSGDATIKGSADSFKAKLAGSGNIKASDLKSKNVEASLSGSGNSTVTCNNALVARVAGSGNIKYLGNPEKCDVKVSGSGNITKG